MKNSFYTLALIFLFFSCMPKNKLDIIDKNSKQESELLDSYCHVDSLMHNAIVEKESYSTFIGKAMAFYLSFPEENITPKMLWNAGIAGMTYARYAKDISDHTDMVEYAKKSIQIFDIIQKVYPDYDEIKNTYLYKGVIYDDILEDYDSAKHEYLEYTSKYPDDSASSNLKEYIKYLGSSADDIYINFNTAE